MLQRLHSSNGNTTEKVCHEGEVFKGKINVYDSMEIKMWFKFTDMDIYNPKCFFWCTNDGEIPEDKHTFNDPQPEFNTTIGLLDPKIDLSLINSEQSGEYNTHNNSDPSS